MLSKLFTSLFALLLISTLLIVTSHAAPFAYMANYETGANSVSVVDLATKTVTATIAVGGKPLAVSTNPAGTRVYVTNTADNTVSVIDTASNTVLKNIENFTGLAYGGIAISPDGKKGYALNYDIGTVSVIDTATNVISDTITTGFSSPNGVTFSPDGSKAYVSNHTADTVSVIDASNDTVTDTIQVDDAPRGLVTNAAGTRLYVICGMGEENSIVSIDTDTKLTVPAERISIGYGGSSWGIAINPAGTKLYASRQTSNDLKVVDIASHVVEATITELSRPYGVSVTPDGKSVVVATHWGNAASIIDSTTLATTTVNGLHAPWSFGNFIASPPPITNGLISLWRGENNAFDVVGSNHGAGIGNPAYATGRFGQAFSLNGINSAITVPDNASLDVSTAFTLSAWVHPSTIPTYPNAALVLSKIGPVGNLYGYQMVVTNNGSGNVIWCGFNEGGAGWPQYTVTGGNVHTGTWSHIACSYDNNTLAVYQDGQMVGSSVVGQRTVANTSSSLRIGSDDVGGQFFPGLIDEVAIYNRALLPKEVLRMYDPNGPVAWWKGEDNALDSIADNDGVWSGTAAYASGKTGQAFSFDGVDDTISVGMLNGAALNETLPFSMTAWINTSDTSPYQTIASNYMGESGGIGNYSTYLIINSGNLIFGLNKRQQDDDSISTGISTGWHFVTATYDGSALNLYLDGVLKNCTVRHFSGASDNTRGWYIGNYPPEWVSYIGTNTSFHGLIDELKIYNRALTATEVVNDYGLISWWRGDGNSTDALGINNASLVGTPSFLSGIAGQAFSFNGTSQYAVVNAPVSLPVGNEPRTVAGWIKSSGPTSGPSGPGYQTMLGYGSPWTNGATFLLEWGGEGNDRKLYLTGWNVDLAGSTQLNYDQWYHVAATYDGTTARLYVNGVPDGSGARALNTVVNSAGLMIGNSPPNDGWHGYFNGLVDEVVVFNRALSTEEIAAIYDGEADTTPDNYSFDDQTRVVPGATATSNTITVSGINQPASIAITSCTGSACEWRTVTNPESLWRYDAGTVTNGTQIQLRQTASSGIDATTDLTISIGGVSDTFSVTTSDHTAPETNTFTISATESTTMAVTVNEFNVTDNVGVTGFMITSSSTPPLASDAGWSVTAPSSATLTTAGDNTLYAWAKDSEGNVSEPMTDSVLLKPVRRDTPTYYTFLQTACGEALTGESISALAVNVPGNVTISGKSLTIKGGHADGYGSQNGFTTIQGTLMVGAGSLTVDRVAVR